MSSRRASVQRPPRLRRSKRSPLAVIAGEALWSEMQRRLAARFDSGELCVVDAAAHFIQFDRPDAVIEAIRSVVARVQEATA